MTKHFLVFIFLLTAVPVQAMPIQFDFRSPLIETLDEAVSFNLSSGGLILTVATSDGLLNRTNNGFGVNATGAGDNTDALDAGSGFSESLTFQFNLPVSLIGFTVSGVGSQDIGEYVVHPAAVVTFDSSGLHSLDNQLLLAGERLGIMHVAGNGFSLDSLSVEMASVPAPATLPLLFAGLLLTAMVRYKRC